jgi:hypothetical protein
LVAIHRATADFSLRQSRRFRSKVLFFLSKQQFELPSRCPPSALRQSSHRTHADAADGPWRHRPILAMISNSARRYGACGTQVRSGAPDSAEHFGSGQFAIAQPLPPKMTLTVRTRMTKSSQGEKCFK